MSKAFTDEETPVPDGAEPLPPRDRDLPITRAGLARLRAELAELSAAGPSEIGVRRARVLAQVLKSVYVQEPSLVDGRVGFGTSVTVEELDGRRTFYEIVGPDEVEPARRQISVASPVARALLGKRAGDLVVLRRPRGDIEVTVVSVTVAPADVPPAESGARPDESGRTFEQKIQSGEGAAVTARPGEGVTVDASDLELQQYLFDLQGYLVIHNVLGAAELAELNRLIDAQQLPSPREKIRFGSAAGVHGPDHGFLNWGEPFCRLLDHEAVMPILRLRLGDCFRLDRLYGIRMHKGQTMGVMHADYGASARNSFTRPGERFHFAPNGIYEGFVVAAWSLADAGPAYGGFWCIPGSHKSNFRLPRQIHEAPEKASCVVIPEIPAGSVVLFTEAVMHGTAPWRGDHERRTLLYKYCVSHMAWSRARVLPPPDVPLTPRQQALLTEPADPHTFVPSLFSDGPGAER